MFAGLIFVQSQSGPHGPCSLPIANFRFSYSVQTVFPEKGTLNMRTVYFFTVLTVILAGCGTNPTAPDPQHVVGDWTYVTESGRGVGRMTFRHDGTYSSSFEITTGIATTASAADGTWSLDGDLITVECSGYVATGSNANDGVTTSLSRSTVFQISGNVINDNGALYYKD